MHDEKAQVNLIGLRIAESASHRVMMVFVAVDNRIFQRVAFRAALFAGGCGPSFNPPPTPPEQPGSISKVGAGDAATGGRHALVGEMCPEGAGGRPAVAPLVMRTVGWTDDVLEIASVVERGSVPRFTVFGVDGRAAGAFATLGVVEVGPQQPVASGTYAGAAPCTSAVAAKPTSGALATRAADRKCEAAMRGCGLAIGGLANPGDPPPALAFATGGACEAKGQLAVDIDGDGRPEAFSVADVLDGIRQPASEWSASPTAPQPCAATFQLYGVQLVRTPDPGKPVDRKSTVVLDVLGVVDVDGDGWNELVLALKFATVRTVVVYTPTGTPKRLVLAGEATSFTRVGS